MQNYIEQFKATMVNAGITPPPHLIDDGQIHRFSTNGKGKDSAGWYVLHAGRFPAGCFGDWRTNLVSSWSARAKDQMTLRERVDNLRLIDHARKQRSQLRAQQQRLAMSKAQSLWGSAIPANDSHPYLLKKRILAFNARQRGSDLMLPIVNVDNEIHSLQFIRPDGSKRLLLDGAKKGRFILVHGKLDYKNILICEGFATGATLVATNPDKCVIAAIDAGNLKAVAIEVHHHHPQAKILICGDDDRLIPGNPGLTKAREAAIAIGSNYTIPNWPFDAPMELTDFNDLMCWQATRSPA